MFNIKNIYKYAFLFKIFAKFLTFKNLKDYFITLKRQILLLILKQMFFNCSFNIFSTKDESSLLIL